jgi:hypothetical protein
MDDKTDDELRRMDGKDEHHGQTKDIIYIDFDPYFFLKLKVVKNFRRTIFKLLQL